MQFSHVLNALGGFAASIVPAARPAQPLEIDFLGPEPLTPFEQAAIGTWVTEDGAVRLELRPDGRFDKAKQALPETYHGRYEVDRSQLYFEGDSGFTALGAMRRGVLSIGETRFLKA